MKNITRTVYQEGILRALIHIQRHLNDCHQTPPDQLRTEICIPLEA